MKPSEAFQLHRAAIRRIVENNDACNPRVFGSVLHGDDTDDSDIDILVDPIDGRTSLMSLVRIKRELEQIRCMRGFGVQFLAKLFRYEGGQFAGS
jgi:predicted nucleotidyltransferase